MSSDDKKELRSAVAAQRSATNSTVKPLIELFDRLLEEKKIVTATVTDFAKYLPSVARVAFYTHYKLP